VSQYLFSNEGDPVLRELVTYKSLPRTWIQKTETTDCTST